MHRIPVLVLMLPLAGCLTAPSPAPTPASLGSTVPTYAAPSRAGEAGSVPAAPAATGELDLPDALRLALLHSPELAAATWKARAARGDLRQAGLPPNPELDLEAEEIWGEGPRAGLGAAELTFAVSQSLELPWKRTRRLRAAALEAEQAAWKREQVRLDVLTEARKAFLEALVAQQRCELHEELVTLADRQLEVVRARVSAGKVPPLERSKARVEQATVALKLTHRRSELEVARRRLAATWGGARAEFDQVRGDLAGPRPVPAHDELSAHLEENPEVVAARLEVELRRAVLARERSAWHPDVVAAGGVKHFNEDDGDALTAGVGVEVPLFDRNQGGIEAARASLAAAENELRARQVAARQDLVRALAAMQVGAEEASTLEGEVLPAAEEAHQAAQRGYEQGKVTFLEVLDARRTLFQIREARIEAAAAYEAAVADCERLVGRVLRQRAAPGGTR